MLVKFLWKKILCTILVICSLASACMINAAEVEKQSDTGITPRASYLAADANITSYGIYWHQPDGYPAYRVWIDNTTGALMTVTITSPSGQTKNIYVTAGNNMTYTNNNAEDDGTYRATFHTYADALSGTIRVRVSTTPLM